MKFSCASIGPDFYVYAMAFARTRFRLKQVYLRRQNRYDLVIFNNSIPWLNILVSQSLSMFYPYNLLAPCEKNRN